MTISVFIQNEAGSRWKHYHDEKTLAWKRKILVSPPYPFPYGFVIGTTAEDGGSVDCFVITAEPLATGMIVACVPIALLEQFENGEPDHNVLAVPEGTSFTQLDERARASLSNYLAQVSGEHLRRKQVTVGRFLNAIEAQKHIERHRDTDGTATKQ